MEDLDAAGEIASESRIMELLANFVSLGFTIREISVTSRLEVLCLDTTLGDLMHWRLASAQLREIKVGDVLIVLAEIQAVEPTISANELSFKVVVDNEGRLGWLWDSECAPA